MKKLIPIALVAAISLVTAQQSQGAMQAKAGAKCTKANSTQTVGNKRFTCIKLGSRLIWNRGVTNPKLIPPTPITTPSNPDPAPTVSSAPTIVARQIFGVQTATAKVHYVNNVPKAKRILRWPNQSQSIYGKPDKIIIVYENMKREAPPCDLSKALCEGPTRVDAKIYSKVLNDGLAEVITLDDLQLDAEYNFGVYGVTGEISESEIVKLLRPQFFLAQSSGLVPDAPTGITVGATAGNLKITATTPIEDGFKLWIIVIGGKFGTSTTVAMLSQPQEILVPAPSGFYIVTSRLVSPSGIVGSAGQTFEVTVN